MATRRDTRKFFSGTRTDFPKMGADGPPVVNASGAPSSNTQMQPRDRSNVAASVPAPRPGRRAATQIDAMTGEHLRDHTDRATTAAVRQARMARAVEETQAGPRTLDMMRHVFGC